MPTHREIHDQQKDIWNAAAEGWKTWDAYLASRFAAVSEALMRAARLAEGQEVLELACGTGEPGIPAAKRIGRGRVIGTDLAEDMMAVAEEKARAQGVANYATQPASALALPFPEGRFDAVLCRWGIMFFPDPPACLTETLRVMKPGAFAAFATWNVLPRNPHLAVALEVAGERLGLPPPSPEAPGPFRYTDPDRLAGEMREAGFLDLRVEEAIADADFDSPDHYWRYAAELIGAFRNAMKKADPALHAPVEAEVKRRARALVRDGRVRMPYSSWVVSGRKP